jgi:hypothetical protein
MDSPETLATLDTQGTERRQTKHKHTTQYRKLKKISNTDLAKKSGVHSCAREG